MNNVRSKPMDLSIIEEALGLAEKALLLLDVSGAPSDIGAHLDLAIQRMHLTYPLIRKSA